MPRLSTLLALLKHYERGDALSDPDIPYLVKEESLTRYRFASLFSANKTVLDIGCGYGYGSYVLSLNAKHVVGIDEDKEAVDSARARYRRDNLEFHQASAFDYLTNSAKYDLIVMFEVIEHIHNQDRLLWFITRALQEGGRLILSTPNRRYTPFYRLNPYHIHEFLPDELLSLVKQHITVKEYYGQLPGRLVLLPLPYFLLMRVVQIFPGASKIVAINRKPYVSRTIILCAEYQFTLSNYEPNGWRFNPTR